MKNFYIKSNSGCADYLSILNETEDGFMVRIFRDLDGCERIIDDYLTKELFESCLRTGYLSRMEESRSVVVA